MHIQSVNKTKIKPIDYNKENYITEKYFNALIFLNIFFIF